MFKETKAPQLNLFTSTNAILSGKSLNIFTDKDSWHNVFYNEVTCRIIEKSFKILFCEDNGTPNASVRIMVAMMILKEGKGYSDEELFENCRFHALTRSALGLVNFDDPLPTESTYYLFRKKIVEYEKAGNENLLDTVFAQITKEQAIKFEVRGKSVRMDSKLMGSNIAWLSRYELIHETFRLFYLEVKNSKKIGVELKRELDSLLKLEANKVTYNCSTEEVKTRLQRLGELIDKILPLFHSVESAYYSTLKSVFEEQYKVTEEKIVVAREKEEISPESTQSPHDKDAGYRVKKENKVKGFTINVTESCDDESLNLIANVDVRKVNVSDVDFLIDDIVKTQEVFPEKIEAIHADGAYHSPDNQEFCKKEKIELHLHAIQGKKGRFDLDFREDKLIVTDTISGETIEGKKVNKEGKETKWKIKTDNGYRYFSQKDIDTCNVRRKIEQTPIEVLQKRNNVEATIFQLGYHYPNAKSRYRGLIKHQMWADMRCLWINFVRIRNFIAIKGNLSGHFFALLHLFFTKTGLCSFKRQQEICFFSELIIFKQIHRNYFWKFKNLEILSLSKI